MNASSFHEGWFSLSVTRGRLSFFLSSLTLALLLVFIQAILEYFEGLHLAILFFPPAVAANILLASQRLRDLNFPVWLAVIYIPPPLAELIFFFSSELLDLWQWVAAISLLILLFYPSRSNREDLGLNEVSSKDDQA